MRVVIAPDSFGGTLSPLAAADAIADGWRRSRPTDEMVASPQSDGGEGLLDVLAHPDDAWMTVEVSGPLGHPVEAPFLLRRDGSAVIESARACGLALLSPQARDPLASTTYGVGELLVAARDAGAARMLVGLGGSATVDGGAGALCGLGFRLTAVDGGGLKIGGGQLLRVAAVDSGWSFDWDEVTVELLYDVDTRLADAARLFGPQKGADDAAVRVLEQALRTWADVVERDLDRTGLRDAAGSGAAGGLGFGLAAGLGGQLRPGAAAVAEMTGLQAAIVQADAVVTGEGRLDATSEEGKVCWRVASVAASLNVPVYAVCGQVDGPTRGFADVEAAAPEGPGSDPAGDVANAAARLAARLA